MPKVLSYPKDGLPHFIDDDWVWKESFDANQMASGKVLVAWSDWRNLPEDSPIKKLKPSSQVGIVLSPEDDVFELVGPDPDGSWRWHLIAVNFPIFRDGRGFSQAHLLRHRLGWTGELRAVGDVLIDQLRQMARVGFDAFSLRNDQNQDWAIEQFSAFSTRLQSDWRELGSQHTLMDSPA